MIVAQSVGATCEAGLQPFISTWLLNWGGFIVWSCHQNLHVVNSMAKNQKVIVIRHPVHCHRSIVFILTQSFEPRNKGAGVFFVRYFFTLCPFTTGMHAQNSLKFDVFSLNVRGIRDQTKRRRMFSYLKDQKAKLYFLQETYSELGDETIWKNEWGDDVFFPWHQP